MSRIVGMVRFVLALALVAAVPARAQPAPEALEQTLRNWVSGLLSGLVDPAKLPLHVTADGDRFHIEVPIGGETGDGVRIVSSPIAIAARSLGDGRWAIDELRFPARFDADDPGAGEFMLSIRDQAIRGIFDPTLATPSSLEGRVEGYQQTLSDPQGAATTTMARIATRTGWQPAGEGRVDLASETVVEGYAATQPLPDPDSQPGDPAPVFASGADRLRFAMHLDGLDFSAAQTLVRTIATGAADYLSLRTDDGAQNAAPAPLDERAMARAAITALGNLVRRAEMDETIDGFRMSWPGYAVKIAKMDLESGFGASGGQGEMHMAYRFAGIDAVGISDAILREYLPRALTLAIRVSGFAKDEGMRLLLTAIERDGPDAPPLDGELSDWLERSPIVVAAELALDLGPATLAGKGSVRISGLSEVVGESVVRVKGLDALMARAGIDPELHEALPALLIIKGLGRVEGEETVWQVAYNGDSVTVNGTDLDSLGGK